MDSISAAPSGPGFLPTCRTAAGNQSSPATISYPESSGSLASGWQPVEPSYNLVPRVLRLFGQRLVARRDSGELEFYYRRISAANNASPFRSSQSKISKKYQFPRVSPADQPWAKEPKDSGYEVGPANKQQTESILPIIWQGNSNLTPSSSLPCYR